MAPALFTRMSMSLQAAASDRAASPLLRSTAWTVTETLWRAWIASRARSRSALVRDAICRWQPSSASCRAHARPMPLEAPVTRASLPLRLRSMPTFLGDHLGAVILIFAYPPTACMVDDATRVTADG